MNTNKTLQYITYILLGATLFVPLILADGSIFPSMFFPFITGKAFVFRILVEIAFAVWLVLAFRDKNARPKISPLTVGVTIFTVVALIVDMTGVNPIRSLWSNFERMEGWVTIIHLWVYFIVFTSVVRVRQNWHRFFNVSFVAAFIVAFWGILQLTGHAQIHQSADRLDASIGNAEYLAVYMLINAFLALYMAVVSWSKEKMSSSRNWGWIYLALAALYSFIIFGTQTRGTILALGGGLFIGLAAFVIFKDKNAHTHSEEKKMFEKRAKIIAGSLLGLIIVITGGFYLVRNTHFVQSHNTFQRLASISLNNPRIQFIWPMALKGFEEKPILGWGQENFNYVFNNYYNPEAWAQEQWFDRAHNVFIDWAINGGIVGFAAYVALFLLAIVATWKSSFSLKERSVFLGLLVAYAIHNMFVFDNLASYLMFFLVLSFLSTEWLPKEGRLSRLTAKLHGLSVNAEAINWIAAPIIVVFVAITLYYINVRPIDENLELISAMQSCQSVGQAGAPDPDVTLFSKALSGPYIGLQEIREQLYSCAEGIIGSQSVSNTVKLAYYQVMSDAFVAQAKSTPDDVRGFLFAGSFYNDLGQWSIALPYLERAYQLSPVKQSVLFALAQNYLSAGTTASSTEAYTLLAKAYTEAPDYPQAQTAYAQSLYSASQYQAAVGMFKKIIAENPTDLQSTMQLAGAYEYLREPTLAITELNIVASSSPQNATIIQKYISQIKAGINPFIPAPATASAPNSGQK